jgi:hypothetical protein
LEYETLFPDDWLKIAGSAIIFTSLDSAFARSWVRLPAHSCGAAFLPGGTKLFNLSLLGLVLLVSVFSTPLSVFPGPRCRSGSGTCYVPTKLDKYPVKTLVTEDGEAVVRRLQDVWCMEGRNGENLVCPFQCDLFHFRNIKKRDPFSRIAMWDSEGQLGCVLGKKTRNGEEQPYPNADDCEGSRRIPWHTQGTSILSSGASYSRRHILDDDCSGSSRSLIECRNQCGHLQFNTIRKTRSAMYNYERTTAPEMRHAALAGYKKGESLCFTNTSVYSLWFDHFIVGCHVRMGDDTMQDRASSIKLILAIQTFLEEDLIKCQSMDAMLNVSLHGVFVMEGFCGGLRGEKLPLMSLDATSK